jgi:hypothetical protein
MLSASTFRQLVLCDRLTEKWRNPLKNAVGSSTGVPLAPFVGKSAILPTRSGRLVAANHNRLVAANHNRQLFPVNIPPQGLAEQPLVFSAEL